jgi:hypothetical protein
MKQNNTSSNSIGQTIEEIIKEIELKGEYFSINGEINKKIANVLLSKGLFVEKYSMPFGSVYYKVSKYSSILAK